MSHDEHQALPTTVAELQALLRRARDEAASYKETADTHKAEAAALAREAAVQSQTITELSATVESQKQQLEKNRAAIKALMEAMRGKKRERIDPNQLLLFEIGELETLIREQAGADDPEESAASKKKGRRKRSRGRRLIPDHLPEEEILHELAEDQRRCPIDGRPMPVIRWETSRQLEYVPPKLKVLVHKRAVYACPSKHDDATLITAPKQNQPIEKGLAGPGLLAAVVVGKFGDHLPGYRLEDILTRHGADIHRATLYDWMAGVADLLKPLYELLKQRVLSSRIIHTDDTQVKLIDRGMQGTRTARFWAYLGDRRNPYEVYDFTPTRERAGPAAFLAGFEGYLQADAYSCYDGIYLDSGGAIVEVACWAHTRRYWHKARENDSLRAHHVLGVISRLYEIESACADQNEEFRLAQRREHAAPLLADLKAWLDGEVFLPKSVIGQAATYTLNQWTALNRYLEDGELRIDNNAAERSMRPVAIGRKNWQFVGSEQAGSRSAVLMSLIASCKACRVEPWAWLADILRQFSAGAPAESLLPDVWLQSHPKHRWTIADRRTKERRKKGNL